MADPPVGEIRAAGAVLWRAGPGGRAGAGRAGDGPALEVALVHRPRYGDWSFPKGKSLPGEHVLATAVREVAEETGVRAVLGRRLTSARYVSEGRPKRVDYWAARAVAATPFVPNAEVDELAWLPLAAARERLTYPHDAALLADFAGAPAATSPVILLRHASAMAKDRWRAAGHADDLPRPLTPRGQAQARALAGALGCFGPARVLSSPAERCLATIAPYAAAAGVLMEAEPALLPGGGDDALQGLAAVAASGPPTVVCAHRENLPRLAALVCQLLGAGVPEGPPLRKGAFWAFHTARGRLVSAERHHLGA